MQQILPKPTFLFIILIAASFSCSPVGLKGALGFRESGTPEAAGISTTETLEREAPDPKNESVSPPANISGSYLMCVEATAATAETPEAIVNCGLRDQVTNSKIDISSYPMRAWTYQVAEATPITAFVADLTTSLEWHVAITLKGSSLAEIQTAQKSIKFLLTLTDAAGNKFQEVNAPALNCSGLTSSSWVFVPGNSVYGTSNFCVMKYEVKDVKGVATSQAAGLPWVNINQTDAIAACQNLGANVHLITNNEWMSLASDIANVNSNWSGGTVGSGAMNGGHSDSNPGALCHASMSDSKAYVEGDCRPLNSGTWSQKRTHTLSTGAVIWDLAGNAIELIGDIISNDSVIPYDSANGSPIEAFIELNVIDAGFTYIPLRALRPIHAEQSFWSDSWNATQGIGQYYGGGTGTGSPLCFQRGGAFIWGGVAGAGVFRADLIGLTFVDGDLGFRCARPAN